MLFLRKAYLKVSFPRKVCLVYQILSISNTQDGKVIKKWEWPPPKLSMSTTISLYLNVHISFRCTGLANMDLRISNRGHSYKFPVGPLMEDLENTLFRGKEVPLIYSLL